LKWKFIIQINLEGEHNATMNTIPNHQIGEAADTDQGIYSFLEMQSSS